MNFYLNREQLALVELAAQVAREQVAPRAAEIDRSGEFPPELFQTFRETGLLGVAVPEVYGGAGLGTTGLALVAEEIAKVCSSSAMTLGMSRLPLAPILYAGTEEQKSRYATATVTGEWRGAFCLTEPAAGSDVSRIETLAVRRGNQYIINGTKSWVTGAEVADFFTVAVKTDPAAGYRGISLLVVHRENPGLSVGPREKTLGIRGLSFNTVTFTDCVVPATNLVGPENGGFPLMMKTLNSLRPVVAARGVGLAQGALQYALEYTRNRSAFGKPVLAHQGLQWQMAALATKIEAARLLVYRAAQLADEGKVGKESAHLLAMAKWFATETAQETATAAIQFMGAPGYTEEHPLERFYRDAKQLTIVEGTTQIQFEIIGKALLDRNLFW